MRFISSIATKSASPFVNAVPRALCVSCLGSAVPSFPAVIAHVYSSFSHTKATSEPSEEMRASSTGPGSEEESKSFVSGWPTPCMTKSSSPTGHSSESFSAAHWNEVMPVWSCRARSRRSFSSRLSVSSSPTPEGGLANSTRSPLAMSRLHSCWVRLPPEHCRKTTLESSGENPGLLGAPMRPTHARPGNFPMSSNDIGVAAVSLGWKLDCMPLLATLIGVVDILL
mmetsp:Transcript_15864/g.31683  ORF Transcript_15864/g.31683 Transcript_15864/m.31683 type:complete len:226 (+) Transcript_15864:222-899(+)